MASLVFLVAQEIAVLVQMENVLFAYQDTR